MLNFKKSFIKPKLKNKQDSKKDPPSRKSSILDKIITKPIPTDFVNYSYDPVSNKKGCIGSIIIAIILMIIAIIIQYKFGLF